MRDSNIGANGVATGLAVSPTSDCTTYGTLDATNKLNLPSITVASVPGTVAVHTSPAKLAND